MRRHVPSNLVPLLAILIWFAVGTGCSVDDRLIEARGWITDTGGSMGGSTGVANGDSGGVEGDRGTDSSEVVSDGSDGTGDGTSEADSALLAIAYCAPIVDWDALSASFENQVLALVNEQRARGADCGSGGSLAPAGPLRFNERLRCAARNHAKDMSERNFFGHTNLDGLSPADRVDLTQYDWIRWGENIAFGQPTPQEVFDAWMASDPHCVNIMKPTFTESGVGYFADRWTQVFGTPR